MRKLIVWLFLAAVVVGIAGLAGPTEQASAVELELDCQQTVDPTGAGTKGEVTCTLTVTDLPAPLNDFTLTLVATYVDVDGDRQPSPGDQLQCITVTWQGNVLVDFCRPSLPTP